MIINSTWQHRTGAVRTITKVCHDHAVICDDNTRWCVDYFQRCHEPIEDVRMLIIATAGLILGLVVGVLGLLAHNWSQACFGLLMIIGVCVVDVQTKITNAFPAPTQEAPQ